MKILEKLQKRLQEGKKDNKGFSLVELIIVIAIMAILVGIVGMNVIPQIENSRKATDEQVLSALCTEAMEAYTQAVYATGDYSIQITVDNSNGKFKEIKMGTVTYTLGTSTLADVDRTTDAGKLLYKFIELGSNETRSLKSNAGKDLGATGATGINIYFNSTTDATDATKTAPIVLIAGSFQNIEVR